MKTIYNYTFKLACIYIIVLSIFAVSNIEIKSNKYTGNTENINKNKVVASAILTVTKEPESIMEVESFEEDLSTENIEHKTETPSQPIVENVHLVDTSSYAVISQETINMSHYGHDCYGCTSGYTASGYYVGDGRIYYQDATFGSVRVVAADSKYPLGTIVRIGYHGSKITAIVLDRGGAISDHNKYQIDLLSHSNSEAYQLGVVNNTTLEVLRLGY